MLAAAPYLTQAEIDDSPADAPRRTEPLRAISAGRPERVSLLARMLLQLHRQPALQLVHEQPSDAVPPVEQGPL